MTISELRKNEIKLNDEIYVSKEKAIQYFEELSNKKGEAKEIDGEKYVKLSDILGFEFIPNDSINEAIIVDGIAYTKFLSNGEKITKEEYLKIIKSVPDSFAALKDARDPLALSFLLRNMDKRLDPMKLMLMMTESKK